MRMKEEGTIRKISSPEFCTLASRDLQVKGINVFRDAASVSKGNGWRAGNRYRGRVWRGPEMDAPPHKSVIVSVNPFSP